MADQFYVVDGYVADDYFGYIAEAEATLSVTATVACSGDIALTNGYVISDYVADDYFQDGVTQEASATLSASATVSAVANRTTTSDATLNASATTSATPGRIRDAQADIDGVFSTSLQAFVGKIGDATLVAQASLATTAERTRSTDVTLNNIVNLSLQGVKTSTSDATLDSSASITSAVAVTTDTSFNATASFSLSADPGEITTSTATLNSTATLTADVSKVLPFDRPLDFTSTSSATFATNPVKYNTYSLRLLDTGYATTDDTTSLQIQSDEEAVVEFWLYLNSKPTITQKPIVVSYGRSTVVDFDSLGGSSALISFAIGYDEDYKPMAYIYDDTFDREELLDTSATAIANQTWTHFALTHDGSGNWGLYVNNSADNRTTSHFNDRLLPGTGDRTLNITNNSDTAFYIDGLHIQRGTDAYNGYTQQPVGNYDTTVTLHDFENSFADNTGYTFEVDATLNSSASLSATPGLVADAITLQASAGTLTCTANEIVQLDAQLDSAFAVGNALTGFVVEGDATISALGSQLVAVNMIGAAVVSISTQASLASTATRIKPLEAQCDSNFQQTTTGVKTTDTDATLASSASLTADPQGSTIGLVATSLDSSATLALTPSVTRPSSATLDSTASLSADGIINIEANAQLDSSATASIDANRIRSTTVSLTGFASTVTVAAKTGDYLVAFDVNTTLSADADVLTGNVVALNASADLTADVARTRTADSTQSSTATMTVSGRASTDTVADFDVTATQTVEAVATLQGSASIDSAASFAVIAKGNLAGEIDLDSVTTLTTTATAIRHGTSTQSVVASISAIGGTTFEGTIAESASFALSAQGRVIDIARYVYTVPAETRTFTISSESRSHTIHSETRRVTVGEL